MALGIKREEIFLTTKIWPSWYGKDVPTSGSFRGGFCLLEARGVPAKKPAPDYFL